MCNSAIIGLYVISRTVGIPLGRDAGEIESLSTISIVSKALQLALVGCLMLLLANVCRQVPHVYSFLKESWESQN